MLLPHLHGVDFYTPFYLLATLTNVLLLLVEGWRRGLPMRPWLTLIAASSLALILGSKLITQPGSEWGLLLFSDAPTSTARSILGGGLAATLTVLALRRWLVLSWAVLDALALPLCGALVVQCVGCVLTGCCFGVPTTQAWGLLYAADTLPWAAQVQAGLISMDAAYSLPVVPTQLLALVLCAAVGGVLLATRHKPWPVGSWLLLQAGLLVLGRAGQAVWRDPIGEPVAGGIHTLLGVEWMDLQLVLLPAGLLLLGIWAWRIKQYRPAPSASPAVAAPAPGTGRHLAVVLVMLVLTALLGRHALTLPEVLVVRGLLLAVLVAEASVGLASLRVQSPRLAGIPLSLALAGMVLLTTAQAPAPERGTVDSTGVTHSIIVTGGALSNYHEADAYILNNNSGCSGGQRLTLQQRVKAAGGEIAMQTAQPSGSTKTWGGGVWVGQQRIDMQPIAEANTSPIITKRDSTAKKVLADIHIYREAHRENGWRSLDLRFGLHVGNLGYYSYFDDDNSKESTLIMPELMIRMGKPSVLYGQADFCYGAENAMGAYTTRFGVGSGLGVRNGSQLLLGYAHSPHQPTSSLGFASAVLRLPGRTGFSLEPYFATDFGRHNNLSLRLNYQFNR
ncbi:prolipoprotein diacylglyceryl transferase family protein [Hymenobacter sp. B1770]|uniref:prolipoprotein diacylglyceryl transferase family protein n=1 Tax=Hymenobacter sp. B1770 TaxID=1718788 RepID=UPI003CEB4C6E